MNPIGGILSQKANAHPCPHNFQPPLGYLAETLEAENNYLKKWLETTRMDSGCKLISLCNLLRSYLRSVAISTLF